MTFLGEGGDGGEAHRSYRNTRNMAIIAQVTINRGYPINSFHEMGYLTPVLFATSYT